MTYLVATIKIGDEVVCINRHQPLRVPPGTYMMPVMGRSDGTMDSSRTKKSRGWPRSFRATTGVRGFNLTGCKVRGWYKNFLMKMRGTLAIFIYR
ncbi:MAG: hypothetical protein U0103_11500 [Candidatus Obscuribacterales bacterium]